VNYAIEAFDLGKRFGDFWAMKSLSTRVTASNSTVIARAHNLCKIQMVIDSIVMRGRGHVIAKEHLRKIANSFDGKTVALRHKHDNPISQHHFLFFIDRKSISRFQI